MSNILATYTLFILLILQAIDVWQTVVLVERYGVQIERNPIVRVLLKRLGVLGFTLFKALLVIGIGYYCWKYDRDAVWVVIVSDLITLYVVIRNVKTFSLKRRN